MASLADELFQQRKRDTDSKSAKEEAISSQAKHDALVAAMQPHQRQLAESTSRYDAVITARQVGKTWGVLLLIFSLCVLRKGQRWVLVGPTLKALKRVYLPAFTAINNRFDLKVHFNKTDHVFYFPNGSEVHLHGADTRESIDRIRGGTFHGFAIDEAQMYPLADLEYLIDGVAESTLKVYRGRLILVGTPGEVLDGLFYAATCTPPKLLGEDGTPSNYLFGEEPRGLWCKHVWHAQANLAAPHFWEDALKTKKLKGWPDNHPTWLRESCGIWTASITSRVYVFSRDRDTYDGNLPEVPPGKEWKYILGADLGQKDGTAMVVWAWSPAHPVLYEVYSEKRKKTSGQKLGIPEIAAWRDELAGIYGPFIAEVCDAGGLGQMILDDFQDTYGFFWEPAEKREKEAHIRLFNDDLDFGKIKIRRDAHQYIAELEGNVWEKNREGYVPPPGRRTESDATPNDLCDAGLYAFRYATHRLFRPDKPEVFDGPAAFAELQEKWRKERADILAMYAKQRKTSTSELEDVCKTLDLT